MCKIKSNILIIIIGITFLVSCTSAHHKRDSYVYSFTPEELLLLKDGDILLRQGHGFVSRMIVETLREEVPISHVGMLTIDPADGQFKVIHSVSQSISGVDGLQIQDLKSFIKDSKYNTLVVVRYRDLELFGDTPKDIWGVAFQYLEKQVPFDYDFDFNSSDKFFCTEFIGRVIWDVYNDEIFSQEYINNISELDRLRFGVFLNPEKFEIVINHQL